MTEALLLTGDDLSVEDVWYVALGNRKAALAPSDRPLSADIERVAGPIRDGSMLAVVEDACWALL